MDHDEGNENHPQQSELVGGCENVGELQAGPSAMLGSKQRTVRFPVTSRLSLCPPRFARGEREADDRSQATRGTERCSGQSADPTDARQKRLIFYEAF